MRLAARERGGGAVERQVAEPERDQHLAPRLDLGDQPLGDRTLALAGTRGPRPSRATRASGSRTMSATDSPATRTARLSGRSRVPRQARQGSSARYGRRSSNASPPASASSSVGTGSRPQQAGDALSQVRHHAREAVLVAEQQHLARGLRQLGDRHLEREVVALGHLDERLAQQARPVAVPGLDRPVENALRLVGDDARGVHHPALAQPVAGRAGAVGAVERERARAELRHLHVAARAGECCGRAAARRGPPRRRARLRARAGAPSRGSGAGARRVGAQHQAVDQHVDAVPAPRVELGRLSPRFAACPSTRARCSPAWRRPGAPCGRPPSCPRATGASDHRGRPGRLLEEPRRHLVGVLRRDRLRAAGAVRPPERREQHAQVVVDLGHRADRRARVARRSCAARSRSRGRGP